MRRSTWSHGPNLEPPPPLHYTGFAKAWSYFVRCLLPPPPVVPAEEQAQAVHHHQHRTALVADHSECERNRPAQCEENQHDDRPQRNDEILLNDPSRVFA